MSNPKTSEYGKIIGINSSIIDVIGLKDSLRVHDLVNIKDHDILGEVIQILPDRVVIKCFENTSNLKLNETVSTLNEPLSMELGPGLLGNAYDGLQRPLKAIFEMDKRGRINKGIVIESLSREKKWHFIPKKQINDEVVWGEIIGTILETSKINHFILCPPYYSGKISSIVKEGEYTINEEIYRITNEGVEKSFTMIQKWPITERRPFRKKLNPDTPLITGIREIDLLYPIAKGGTFAIPGGFGTGKTIIQQTIAKYCNADIIVYIGCGEPGNEIANILKQFNEEIDPETSKPLMERVILVANTSNMPVSAREASLFSGITIAEYYRDMGYDVAIISDSTSRWAESLREISSLLEEMPAEEGYPAYLPSKLSKYYERAGLVETNGRGLDGKELNGSITIIASISPPGGDFNEPVTAATKRLVQGLWALDPKLAYLKHYPAIDWLNSYSNYPENISTWWYENDISLEDVNLDWYECRNLVNELLSKENEFKMLIQLTGESDLLDSQKFDLFIAKIIRNTFLMQNAFEENESYSYYLKTLALIKLIFKLYFEGKELLIADMKLDDRLYNEVLKTIIETKNSISNADYQEILKNSSKIVRNCLDMIFISK